jgi:hypothetical protein
VKIVTTNMQKATDDRTPPPEPVVVAAQDYLLAAFAKGKSVIDADGALADYPEL